MASYTFSGMPASTALTVYRFSDQTPVGYGTSDISGRFTITLPDDPTYMAGWGSGSAPAQFSISRPGPAVPLASSYTAAGWTPPDATTISMPTATSLRRFRQQLANTGSAPLYWLAIGDSITEGAGASTLDKAWIHLVRAGLQRQYTPAGKGGFGFLNTSAKTGTGTPNPNLNGSGSGSAYWTFSGGSEGGSTGQTAGLLGLRRRVLATSETATLTFTGTGVDVHYTLGGTAFTYAVDGGSTTTITPGAGTAKTGKTAITGLSSAAHSIVFAPSGATTMPLLGVTIHDGDEAGGVWLLNDGQFGITSGTVAAATGPGGATYLTDILTLWPNPALVTIHLSTNDPANSITPAQTAANLTTIIANVKAKCTINPSFLLVVPAVTGGNASAATPWSQYVAAIKGVQAADPTNVAVIDLTADFVEPPSTANSNSQGVFSTDNTHPKDPGHRLIAQRVMRALVGDLAPL